jgi:transglutaminase-like putative cysteine protease
MAWVHSQFTYAPRSTTAYTRMAEALERRTGVCQDYAHVLIGLCRSLQIPALYVSGYLSTPGADASHAWVEIFIPELGWRALDPTHNHQPDDNYVKVAVGRDYSDVPPTRGHYKGTQQRSIEVEVQISPDLKIATAYVRTLQPNKEKALLEAQAGALVPAPSLGPLCRP